MGKGPLSGIKIIEMTGIGPGPYCAMLLSDMGAEVLRIDRKGGGGGIPGDPHSRGRRSLALDLKKPEAVETVLRLVEKADALQEGYRPGVMERLGLGPDVCLSRNEALVYGRMTGWGQYGPLAQAAGHDINYISLTGALAGIGKDKPTPPLNLVGDFGGGSLFLALGMVSALLSARNTGKGQVVDAAMTDGATSLMGMFYGMMAAGVWQNKPYANMLDGAAHFYDTYETKDGKFVSIGSIEPQFYALLCEKAGFDDAAFDAQMDKAAWPDLKAKVAEAFKTKTRDEWDEIMLGTDICYAPVLDMDEAFDHPHNRERDTITEAFGIKQPNVAPRFSGTPSEIQGPPPKIGEHNDTAFADWGIDGDVLEGLKSADAI